MGFLYCEALGGEDSSIGCTLGSLIDGGQHG